MLEEPVKVHVLQAILTIVISLAKKKSGGEESRPAWTLPNYEPKDSTICKIRQELGLKQRRTVTWQIVIFFVLGELVGIPVTQKDM